jgi:hypothetical protein
MTSLINTSYYNREPANSWKYISLFGTRLCGIRTAGHPVIHEHANLVVSMFMHECATCLNITMNENKYCAAVGYIPYPESAPFFGKITTISCRPLYFETRSSRNRPAAFPLG